MGGSATGTAKEAAAVFVGKVVSRELVPLRESGGHVVAFKFKVERVWKGRLQEEVLISTLQVDYQNGIVSLPAEDFSPRLGESYLVYAYTGQDGRLTTKACSRSRRLKDAEEDIQELGVGYLPEKKDVSQ